LPTGSGAVSALNTLNVNMTALRLKYGAHAAVIFLTAADSL
jgi:hypothetical protein